MEVIMQQSPVEVERKWLVQDLPDLSRHEGKEVIQGYIAISADGTEVRLRQTDGKFFQTVKSEGGLVRDEIEIDLITGPVRGTLEDSRRAPTQENQVYLVLGGKTVEIDVYHGSLWAHCASGISVGPCKRGLPPSMDLA
jgi:CYTH domain-containing protein